VKDVSESARTGVNEQNYDTTEVRTPSYLLFNLPPKIPVLIDSISIYRQFAQ
jgi:hypothetical protein